MINDNLLNGTAALLSGSSYTLPSYLAFGSSTGTLTATDVITSGEFDRTILDTKTSVNNTVKYIGSRSSATAGDETIQIIGLHNSGTLASSGNLQAAFLIASLIHTTSFDIDAEFWISVQRV